MRVSELKTAGVIRVLMMETCRQEKTGKVPDLWRFE